MRKKKAPGHLASGAAEKTSGQRRGPLWWITGIIAVLAIGALVFYIVYERGVQQEYEDLERDISVTIEPVPTPEPTIEPADTPEPAEPEVTPEPTPEPVRIPFNYPYYQEINDDIIAWIEVEGTDIDYVVLYDTDSYYLDHNYKKQYSYSGSIFMQDYNHSDFSDFNTVLFGHNMGSGAMFAQLHRFEDSSFFDAHDTIIVYTPNSILTYKIFAAYRTDNLNIMTNFSFDTVEDREAYIDRIFRHTYSNFDYDVPVTESDRIITLSTCINNPDYRYLVQGVLVKEEYGYWMPKSDS